MIITTIMLAANIVSFKDADKIKSWDAWDDHKAKVSITNILQKEKRCVTWEKLNKLDPGLKESGRLVVRESKDIKSSKWSVGCETMDRDYADWDSFKALLPGLGVKHARFFSGWAKTEQEKGVYDFTWLDPHIRECAAMGIKPWICISYGNPVWGSDFRLGMRVKQVSENPEALAAWLRYTKALVARYKDVVDEWEIWNEPFGQGQEYSEFVYATAKAVREVQPEAKCLVACMAWWDDMKDYRAVAEKLKRENALDLVKYWVVHPYDPNPDTSYRQCYEPLKRLIAEYSPDWEVVQGEVGCPSQLEYAHAMCNNEWTEYSQAKWLLRRAVGDAVRSVPSNIFTMIDLKYTFMLQSYGLVRSNLLKEFVYRRPSYYAMSNVFNLLDDDAKPLDVETRKCGSREITRARFTRGNEELSFFWFSDAMPSNELVFEKVDLKAAFGLDGAATWTDMITGRVFELGDVKSVPLWDSPALIRR